MMQQHSLRPLPAMRSTALPVESFVVAFAAIWSPVYLGNIGYECEAKNPRFATRPETQDWGPPPGT